MSNQENAYKQKMEYYDDAITGRKWWSRLEFFTFQISNPYF